MNPHETLPAGTPSVTDHQKRCFVALCTAALFQKLLHPLIDAEKCLPAEAEDPVVHGLAGQSGSKAREFTFLPVQRKVHGKLVAEYNNMTCNDYAHGGASMVYRSGYSCIYNQIVDAPSTEPDFVLIGGGVNDLKFTTVGTFDEDYDYSDFTQTYIDNLDIKECVVTHLTDGKGTVRCQHGILPVPVPAVLHVVADNHIPIEITDIRGELVTPTGAASVAAICTTHELPKTFKIEKIGLGAGKRQYECAGILRAMLID